MTEKVHLAVLLSGGGTTFQYIQDRIDAGELPAVVEVVVSSRADAGGLRRAADHNIPHALVDRKKFAGSGSEVEARISREIEGILSNYRVDLVVLAGFMTRLSTEFVQRFRNRIMNTHPALIPAFCGEKFYGERVHAAVIEYGVKYSGCTIHFVDEEYDHGPIILQKVVPVTDDDTVESIGDKVRFEEKILYCEAIRLFAEGRLRVEGRRVRILPEGQGGG